MQVRIIFYLTLLGIFLQNKSFSFIPHPDHVVVLILENTSYSEIVGSASAPYINSLINDPQCAFFTQSFGLSRPSQPNYLQLFSGSAQGVTTNNLPTGLPFTTPNLGAQLIGSSKTFVGYSESMPNPGYTGVSSGAYARKHNPWVNWQGSVTNGIPASLNETFLAFPPSANYNSLPHLSIVVPNENNDMHNGTYPARITTGDTWVQNNLDAYIQWAKANNSLFILTFDEDDYVDQHIVTLFIGPMVNDGSYSNYIDHYNLLRLMEDMFYLPGIGGAATAAPIDYCWLPCYQLSNITASGPTTFCQGESVTLTAAGGSSFLWSTGETSKMITVNSSGNYSVTINDGAGCTSSSKTVNVTVNNFNYSSAVFSETMGIVSNTTLIPAHEANNGFDNVNLLMTGTGDIRNNTTSSGYTTASGNANVFLTNTIGKYFQIENINTTSLANLQLSFGIYKSSTAATGADLLVQYSLDGTNYTSLTFDPLPVGTNTAIWYYRTCTGSIPIGTNLRIKFIQNGTVAQYRIDDVLLKYTLTVPLVSANGPVTFCAGGNVTLSATTASSYLWSTGANTQSINVSSSGNYQVVETGANGCTAASNIISVNVNPVPVINNFTPANGSPGVQVTINGSGFSGITSVAFNGSPASFMIINSNQLTARVPPGSTSGTITLTNNCSTGSSPQPFAVDIVPSVFQLKVFIEGYYAGSGQMCAYLGGNQCDSVTVELRNTASPFNVVYSLKKVINTSGLGTFSFPASANGNTFYVSVFGHNSLKTWSSFPLIFSSNTNYDFTISQNQAYGGNLKNLGDGNFALFSGDVNSDGFINLQDHAEMINSIKVFNTGYNKHDLNCDSVNESSDFSIIENNLNVVSLHP